MNIHIAVVVYLRQNSRRTLLKLHTINILFCIILVLSACKPGPEKQNDNIHATANTKDVHSYANPDEIAVKHSHLDLLIDFEIKR